MIFCYLVWSADKWIISATIVDDISDQMLLTIVGSEDGNLFRWVANESHVHVSCYYVLSLCQILLNVV
jgi:hypothetical protein